MNQMNGLMLLSSLLQPGLAGYALHLNRSFGSRSVGWWVFSAFGCLALLQLVHLLGLTGSATELVDICISLLLLAGMMHTQSAFASQAKLQRAEQKLRAEVEDATHQAAELASANQNLVQQLLLREQREQALKASEQQLSRLFVENPLPMWVFELNSLRFLTINEAALRYYGYLSTELMAQTAHALHCAEDIPAFLEECARPTATSAGPKLWHHRRKDGLIVEVELTTLDLMYDGRPARLVVAYDAGGRRQREQQLLEAQELVNAQVMNLDVVLDKAMKTLGD